MFDRFTDRARKIMSIARQESEQRNHGFIGPEHILLGLLLEGHGVAANVLATLQVDLNELRRHLEKKLESIPSTKTINSLLPFTQPAKKVLHDAITEARSMDHDYVGSEHLILGLLHQEDGIVSDTLRSQPHLKLHEVRNEVLVFLDAEQKPPPDPMLGRFTDHARHVISAAKSEAVRINHDYIGTEHLLLALLRIRCSAVHVLENLDVDLKVVEKTIIDRLKRGAPIDLSNQQLPFTPRAKKVIELGIEEARELHHKYVGTEHLLLGLMREENGLAADVLRELGLNFDCIRGEVLAYLGESDAK